MVVRDGLLMGINNTTPVVMITPAQPLVVKAGAMSLLSQYHTMTLVKAWVFYWQGVYTKMCVVKSWPQVSVS